MFFDDQLFHDQLFDEQLSDEQLSGPLFWKETTPNYPEKIGSSRPSGREKIFWGKLLNSALYNILGFF